MNEPEELEPTQEIERKVLSAFQTQDPDPLYVDRLQKKLADHFKDLERSAENKDKIPGRSAWLDKSKLLLSPLAWGAIGVIFVLFLIWGIRTLLPRVQPSISVQSSPSPAVSPSQSIEPTQGIGDEGVIQLPTTAGMPVPWPEEAITSANAAQITELARWGRNPISTVFWAPDGNSFAVATGNIVHIYHSTTIQEVNAIDNGSSAYQIAYSPDGTKLAVGSYDNPVKIYDASSGSVLQTLESNQMTTGLAYSPEGVILASGAYDREGAITVWDPTSGKELRTLCESAGLYFAFSPDWSILATASGRTIKLWDVTSGKELRTLTGHTEDVWGITFSGDGSRLASWQSGMEMIIKVWEVTSGSEQSTLNVGESIWDVIFLSDGDTLVTSAGSDPITLWDIASGQVVRTIGDAVQGSIVALAPDGKRMLFYGWQGDTVKLYDIASGEELHKLDLQIYTASSVIFSPDGGMVAVGLDDGQIRFLDAANGRELRTLTGHTNGVNSLAFSPDETLLASGSADSTNILWDATTGEQLNSMEGVKEFGWGTGAVPSVDFSPDGTLLALAGPGGQVKVWDAAKRVELRTLGGQAGGTSTDALTAVAFSPDGKILASGYAKPWSQDPSHLITLWDPISGQELRSLEYSNKQQLNVSSLAFSPDGKTLAAGYWEAKVTLWDVASGSELYTVSFPWQDEISSVAFSPGGDVLAIGCGNGSIVLLEAASGQEVATLPSNAYVLAFSPDGKMLVSTSYDGYIRLWGIAPQNTVQSEAAPAPEDVEIESITTIATQTVPEDIGMEKIPIPKLVTGEGLQAGWWSPGGSYFYYSQQGAVGEAGPNQAYTTLYFLDALTGETCQGVQETTTFTQTEWGPSPEGAGMYERIALLDDDHFLYISPESELLSLTPCSDAIDNWSPFLQDTITSINDVKKDGSQVILQGAQAYWLFTPASHQSVKLNIPLPEEGKVQGIGWIPGEDNLYTSRVEDRQGEWWLVFDRIDLETGNVSLILETQASPEIQNSYPMFASIDWLSKDKVIVDNTITGMRLYDLSSQPPQFTNVFPDLFGMEYPGMGNTSAWGKMCGNTEQDYHLMVQTDFGQDSQYYIYHADTGAVDQYPLDPPLLVVYPCGDGGIAKSYWEASPADNTYKVILVDSGTEPYDLVAKGHVPTQNFWSIANILPGGQQVMFASTKGISIVDLKSGETKSFWGLDDQVEYQDFYPELSPDGKTVVGFASQIGGAPGEGSYLQDIYWLRLEP